MTTAPRPFVFVLMPFADTFDDAYELAIQPACEAAGAYAERVDKQIFSGSILSRIYNQISKADLVVADMSEQNPNVFYEVGYAHALSKTTILLTRNASDIPFDLKDYSHVVYNDRLSDLKRQLEARVRHHLEQDKTTTAPNAQLRVRVNGQWLDGTSGMVSVPIASDQVGIDLKVEFENRLDRFIAVAEFQVALFIDASFEWSAIDRGNITLFEVDAKTKAFLSQTTQKILPGAWDQLTFTPCISGRSLVAGETHKAIIRVYSKFGVADFPFTIHTVPKSEGDPHA